MEMLKRMEYSMRERDSQLRMQLKMRDEYFDAELGKMNGRKSWMREMKCGKLS